MKNLIFVVLLVSVMLVLTVGAVFASHAGLPLEPVLSIEMKYAMMGVEVIQPASIYANPELNLASLSINSQTTISQSQNPELMAANHFTVELNNAESIFAQHPHRCRRCLSIPLERNS